MEVARLWCGGGQTVVPPELASLLTSHELTRDLAVATALPEFETSLAGESGGPRRHDLLLLCATSAGRVVVGVEAKTDEPFDENLARRIRRVERLLEAGGVSAQVTRARRLSRALFGRDVVLADGLLDDALGRVPYQLLAGAAGTLIEAGRRDADLAVFCVHALHRSGLNARRLRANLDGFQAFVTAVARADAHVTEGVLTGPFLVPGGEGVPQIPLLLGIATSALPVGL